MGTYPSLRSTPRWPARAGPSAYHLPMPDFDSPFHRLTVTDNDGVRLLKFERNQQSSMLIDDPFETTIEYVGYLHITMAVKPDAAHTLVIGLGGGSVVKRMWRYYPSMRLDVAEIDPEVVEVASALFELPDDERIAVHIADGREFLGRQWDAYDIIIVDAFDDDRVPRPLLTEEFMRLAKERLAPDGVIAWNLFGAVYGPHSRMFRSFHRTATNVWRNVWVFPLGIAVNSVDDTRNIVVLASDSALTPDELAERIGSRVDGLVTVPAFERFAEDLYRGGIRSGDVGLLTDENARPIGGRRKGAKR
jgi:spermidine synthase